MVCCDKNITVFSFNGREYIKSFFENVSIFGSVGIESANSGFEQNSEFVIRIPGEEEIAIKPGDRVIFGNQDVFEPENAYTVMQLKDNRRGNLKHYLVIIK